MQRRRGRRGHPSAERTLSLAAEDEMRQAVVGTLVFVVRAGGPIEVDLECEDEDEVEGVLVRSLIGLQELCRSVLGDKLGDDDDEA